MQGALFTVLLLIVSFVDLKRQEIPDWVSGGIVAPPLLHTRPECLLGIILALFFLAAAVRRGIGGGDVKLVVVRGLVLRLQHATMGTMLGLLLQLLFHLRARCVLPLFKRSVWSSYPMAPFLTIGYVVAYYVQRKQENEEKSAEFVCIDWLYEYSRPSIQEKDRPFVARQGESIWRWREQYTKYPMQLDFAGAKGRRKGDKDEFL